MYKYDAFGRKYFESGPPLVDGFAYTVRKRHDRTGCITAARAGGQERRRSKGSGRYLNYESDQ